MFDAGIFTNSANAPSWSIPIIRKFWQICVWPSRHWWQWPQLTCISALTKSPAFTAVTSAAVRATTPQNSCPSVTGGLIRPCDPRSHPYICKSVPQIEAVRTRTKPSPGPIDGTGAFSNESPRAACILRKAFIVDGMEKRLLVGQSMLAHANSRGAAPLRPSSARSQSSVTPASSLLKPPISPVPPLQSSPAPADTPTPSPPAPARTPPKPHRESPAYSVSHSRNSALHKHILPRRPTTPHNSTASASPHRPFSYAPRNSHNQTPLEAPSAAPSAARTYRNLPAGLPFGPSDRSTSGSQAPPCASIPSAASPAAPSQTTVWNPASPFPG